MIGTAAAVRPPFELGVVRPTTGARLLDRHRATAAWDSTDAQPVRPPRDSGGSGLY